MTYRVASGSGSNVSNSNLGKPAATAAAAAVTLWSDNFTFTAPFGAAYKAPHRPAPGHTIVDVFGDMGVYNWNNMANMEQDLQNGMLDAVFHIGDHAYNLGAENDQRGDGYMQAYV